MPENLAVGNGTALQIEVVDEDVLGGRVYEIHFRVVQAPPNPVGDRGIFDHAVERHVGVEPEEDAFVLGSGDERVVHGAHPVATEGVDGAVVSAHTVQIHMLSMMEAIEICGLTVLLSRARHWRPILFWCISTHWKCGCSRHNRISRRR